MDFTKSGRVDTFEFEKIDPYNLNKSLGKLKGVTGGTLTFDYNSETKVSGSLNVIGESFINNCLIRVWYKPKLDGKEEKFELCTCFAVTEKLKYENKKYSGTIDLKSVLVRHTDDKLPRHMPMNKNDSAVGHFKFMFGWLGGHYKISGIKDKKLTKSVVMEFGDTPMKWLQYLADFLGGEITCDTHGRTVLQKYVSPSRKTLAYTIPSGQASVTLPGVDMENTTGVTPNRVVCRWTFTDPRDPKKREQVYYRGATVSSSSANHYKKTGRHITETYDITNLSPQTTKRLEAVAKSKLSVVAGIKRRYELQCFYLPIHIGEVVRFSYDAIDIDGLVENIDMDLSAGGMMRVTLRRIRTHA